jgi:molecular chaperone GrpE
MKEEGDIEIDQSDLDDSVVGEESALASIKKLKERLKEVEKKAKEYLDGWQRAQADFANVRRRDEESRVEFIKFAKMGLVEELIPVLDSFNIALAHPTARVEEVGGLESIYSQFMGVLRASGLEEINPLSQTFSPYEHEALATIPTEKSEEDHKILEVLQKGYKLNGKVVRPAKVKVGELANN